MATEALRLGTRAPVAAAPPRGVRPVAAVRVAIACLLVGNLGRIPVLTSGEKQAPVLVNELALVVALAFGAVACLRARSLRLDAVALYAIAFAGVGALSAALATVKFGLTGAQLVFALAYLARWVAYFGLYVVLLNVATPADTPALWRTYERTTLAFAAFGVVQSLFLPGFAQMVFPEDTSAMRWDHQGHRLVSSLLDPNFAGAFVVMPLLVLLARVSFGERVARWKIALLVAAALMTVSRSTVLALIVGLIVIASVRGIERRLARLLAGGFLLLLPTLPLLVRVAASFDKLGLDTSAMLRVVAWLRALTVLADNPWLGIGFNTYGFVQARYGFEEVAAVSGFTLDGGLLFIGVMTGAVGVALYFLMTRALLRRCRALWRDARRPAASRGTALGVAAVTAALLVHSVFVNSLLFPFVVEAQWLLWALVFLEARRPLPAVGAA